MESAEDGEPIYELAIECERLLIQQTSKLRDADQPSGVKILSELSQRFAAWTNFLGVFAESNVSLDHKLRRHVEIQDQVLRLLDILQRNLAYLFEPGDSADHMDIELSDLHHPQLQPLSISFHSLDAISKAIERLNHLGISIRRSSVTSQTTKSRKFAEKFDFTFFEGVAYSSIKTLYPEITEGLVEQLTRSMAETYSRFLRRKSRQEQLRSSRSRPRPPMRLATLMEDPGTREVDLRTSMDIQAQLKHTDKVSTTKRLQARLAHMSAMSEPTSLDTLEFRKRINKMASPSVRPMSVLVNQREYPKPVKGSLTCDWCFSPLSTDSFKGLKWRRHVNEDHEPYVCISESCSESLIRFSSVTQWLEHMCTSHGRLWHREVHTRPLWACPLCSDEEIIFPNSTDLTEHIDNLHGGTFTMSQIQAIVNQSRVQGSREQDICPLCCLQVEGQPDSLPTDASGIDEFLSSEQPYCKSIPNKRSRRINTENFYTHIDHNNDSDLEMTSTYRDSKRTSASSSSRNTSVDTIGIHVAMHLQGIMLLTLRLISIDGAMDVLDEDQSAPGSTDNPSLSIRLGERSLSQDMHDIEDVSVNSGGEFGPDENPHSRHTVPDCEHIDWSVVPRRYEVPPDLEQSEIPFRPGPDLEVFISNYPLPRRITYEEDDLGQDLEEFISSPPMGALREQDYLGWELEEFISDGPEEELRDTKNLGEDVEDFISKGPN